MADPARWSSTRILLVIFAVVVLLVVIYVFRHIQGDPIEQQRLNPESRPRVEGTMGGGEQKVPAQP